LFDRDPMLLWRRWEVACGRIYAKWNSCKTPFPLQVLLSFFYWQQKGCYDNILQLLIIVIIIRIILSIYYRWYNFLSFLFVLILRDCLCVCISTSLLCNVSQSFLTIQLQPLATWLIFMRKFRNFLRICWNQFYETIIYF